MRLEGKVAVITGAASGMGLAIATRFAAEGARVIAGDRNAERLLAAVSAIGAAGGAIVGVQGDIGDRATAEELVDLAVSTHGRIDVLVNNAGVQIVRSATETAWAEAEKLLVLDLHTPLRLTQVVLQKMIPRGRGTIVDIASMAAIGPTPGMFFYNAAKAGLAAASEGLRAEVKPHGIHVVTVYPGPVTSDMEAAARVAYEATTAARHTPTGSPEVLAKLVADAVKNKRARVIYPRFYALSRHFPNLTRWAIDALTPPLKALGPRR